MSKKRRPAARSKTRQASANTPNSCQYHFIDGAFFEVLGKTRERYRVQFLDSDTGEIIHEKIISNNHWVRTARKYFTRWEIRVSAADDPERGFSHHYDCRGKRVYVALESASLGDTLAWLPAVEEFRRSHGCQMICSTFMNGLFKETYPEIEFIEPGTLVHQLYAMYRIGLFYHEDGKPNLHANVGNVRERPLAQAAFDILGLEYREIRPRLRIPTSETPLPGKYVCIAVHATCQAKYWNHPSGWKELIDYFRESGYQVVLLSKEGMDFMGNRVPEGVLDVPEGPLDTIMSYLAHAAFFIGVGSGLSWLAWALGCKTCLISGFSYPYTEPADLIRVFPQEEVCSGCFNRQRLDPGDWNWCPDHKDTPRMFECSRTISARQVIEAIAPHLGAAA